MSGDGVLVGRSRELAVVVDVMTSSGRALTVTGDAGVGKSRLVTEASTAAEERGQVVLRGQCLSLSASLSLLPFLDVLRALVDLENGQVWSSVLEGCPSSVRRELARLVPDSVDPRDAAQDRPADGDGQRGRLFDAVRAVLTTAAERHGVSLVIEDMHWADPATVDLVEYLMSPSHHVSAPMVLTFRTNDPASSGADSWLGRLPRTPAMSVLTLPPLGLRDAASQIRSLAGRELPMADVQTLYERSEGNPFFTEQLVQWVLEVEAGRSVGPLPQGLTSLLKSRTEPVTGSAHEVMACLAVAGRGVDEDFLAECCGQPVPPIRQALRELADRRLLRSGKDLGLRLAHALLDEVVTLSLLPGEVRDWHQRIAEAMARQGTIDEAGTVAEHFRSAGLEREELRWRIAAAERCQAVLARGEAAAHWMRAISLLESPTTPPAPEGTTHARIYASAAISLKIAGDRASATALAQKGLERFGEDTDLATRAALLTGFGYDPRNGDPQDVRDALRQALEIYEQLPPQWGYLRAAHDYWISYQATSHPEAAVAALDRALAVAPNVGAPMPHYLLLMDRALLDATHGDVDAAFGRLSEARSLPAIFDEPLVRVSYATVQTNLLLRLGRLSEVLSVAEGLGFTWADTAQNYEQMSALRCNVFEALTELGDIEGAAAVIEPATDGTPQPSTWYVYAARAKLEMLRGHLAESDERWDALPRLHDPALDCEIEPWRLELKLWLRHPQQALAQAVGILEELVDTSDSRSAGQVLLMALRAHADLTSLPATRSRQPPTPETAQTLKELHTRMAVDPLTPGPLRPTGDADGLLWQAEWGRAAGLGDSSLWDAAAEAYERHNRPHTAAYARWRQAETLLVNNGRGRAAVVLLQADRLANQHVPLGTAIAKLAARAHIRLQHPASEPEPAHLFGLTNREMTVLRLVCRGDTNAKIGAKLFISERTAGVHVSNILRKLDVANRVEAANVAEQLQLFPENN